MSTASKVPTFTSPPIDLLFVCQSCVRLLKTRRECEDSSGWWATTNGSSKILTEELSDATQEFNWTLQHCGFWDLPVRENLTNTDSSQSSVKALLNQDLLIQSWWFSGRSTNWRLLPTPSTFLNFQNEHMCIRSSSGHKNAFVPWKRWRNYWAVLLAYKNRATLWEQDVNNLNDYHVLIVLEFVPEGSGAKQ